MSDASADAIDPQDRLICLRAGDCAGPVMPPVVQASLFRFERLQDLFAAQEREHEVSVYSRGTNPTVFELEQVIARLERAEAAKCFGSGMGAISATLFALLEAGDHVLFCGDIYGPAIEMAQRLESFGVRHSRCFEADIDAIAAAITPGTRLIYCESPGSMRFEQLPLARIASLARERGILTAIDNTAATPLLQKPLTLGFDLSLHSCTKYIGGHSDTLGGAVAGSRELVERIFRRGYMLLGAAMAPHDAWLHLRGLMTLPQRLAQQQADGLVIARFLADHPKVRRVFHPALAEGAQAQLFAAQMRGPSGLFSVELDQPDHVSAIAVANRLELFGKAISWGGVESLVTSPWRRDPSDEEDLRMPRTMLRFSIGLEGRDALIADLAQALS